jgi:stage V sporulation protein AF
MKNALRLDVDYRKNVAEMDRIFAVQDNFDVIKKVLSVGSDELTLYYIDGFVKDGTMTKIFIYLLGLKGLERLNATSFMQRHMPYVEAEVSEKGEDITRSLLSGATVMLGSTFGAQVILVDARTYPARDTAEPEGDLVMRGARDGFVETLIFNTALIRRRVRDPDLVMDVKNIGEKSRTDVVLCYMSGIADDALIERIRIKLAEARPQSLTLGFQSLAESLIKRGWWNPFPKIRTTERPDTAAAQLMEGSILLICDTSPQVMILPTSIFSYLEQADDYYFPPLTGSYLRIIRTAILILSVIITPLWYLAIEQAEYLPEALRFLVPDEPGYLPIILQLFLSELAIDGLKIASMNTPDMLSNSLSVVGALLLGDFAVGVGWLSEDVILYMAFVAIPSFAQQNYELGYAFKFMRMLTLGLVYLLGVPGFVLGMLIFVLAIATNNTVFGRRYYLFPMRPCSPRKMKSILFRLKKDDFEV